MRAVGRSCGEVSSSLSSLSSIVLSACLLSPTLTPGVEECDQG